MAHVPHVLVARPWPDGELGLNAATDHHLARALRVGDGAPLSYTDGAGVVGIGRYHGGRLIRGEERTVEPAHPEIVLAASPPRSNDRLRFLVEKAAELEVREIRWLRTSHGEGRPPRSEKALAWATAALEQSRGAWLTRVAAAEDQVTLSDLDIPDDSLFLVAHFGGIGLASAIAQERAVAVAIGPEGGFEDHEIPERAIRVGLGYRVLRIETAAIAAIAAVRLR